MLLIRCHLQTPGIRINNASFAALAASELFIQAGEVACAGRPQPWAALVAALVAWRTGNVLATIAVGMAALYLLKALL